MTFAIKKIGANVQTVHVWFQKWTEFVQDFYSRRNYEQLCSSLLHDATTMLQISKGFALNASKSFYQKK